MLTIGGHHKQAVIKLINCITTANSGQSATANRYTHTAIDASIFEKLTQIIKVYDSAVNSIDDNEEVKEGKGDDNGESGIEAGASDQLIKPDVDAVMIATVRSWLLANYNCEQMIDDLFCHWLPDRIDPNNCFGIDTLALNSDDKLWTITLLVLNILYKMRNCLSDHKMMLELGWICLSELDSSLAQFRPNYNQILNVLQNALKEEKRDNKKHADECHDLSQEVKRLRQKIIELQRNIIKVNKDKQVLGKREVISSKTTYRKPKGAAKRAPPPDSDDDGNEPSVTPQKRKRKSNGNRNA